jgi:TetR/AcrR family transcriptional repressor of nem operon
MTPIIARPKVRGGDTRQRLIRAGTELMWEFGYADVSIDDILTRADALRGSFYHFFSSKQDFLIACLHDYWDGMAEELHAIYAAGSPERAIEGHMRWFVALQEQNLGRYGRVLGGFHQSIGSEHHHNPVVAAVGQTLAKQHEDIILSALKRLEAAGEISNPEMLVRMITYCIDGALFKGRVCNSLGPARELPGLARRILRAARHERQHGGTD